MAYVTIYEEAFGVLKQNSGMLRPGYREATPYTSNPRDPDYPGAALTEAVKTVSSRGVHVLTTDRTSENSVTAAWCVDRGLGSVPGSGHLPDWLNCDHRQMRFYADYYMDAATWNELNLALPFQINVTLLNGGEQALSIALGGDGGANQTLYSNVIAYGWDDNVDIDPPYAITAALWMNHRVRFQIDYLSGTMAADGNSVAADGAMTVTLINLDTGYEVVIYTVSNYALYLASKGEYDGNWPVAMAGAPENNHISSYSLGWYGLCGECERFVIQVFEADPGGGDGGGGGLRNTYKSAILDDPPDAYWRLNNAQEPVRDTMGMHDLVMVGTPTFLLHGAVADAQARSMGDWYPRTTMVPRFDNVSHLFGVTVTTGPVDVTGGTLNTTFHPFPPNEPLPQAVLMPLLIISEGTVREPLVRPDRVLTGVGGKTSTTVVYGGFSMVVQPVYVKIEYLVVGGGGGAGGGVLPNGQVPNRPSGGGGGGDVLAGTANLPLNSSWTVEVGGGGSRPGGSGGNGYNGGNSAIYGITNWAYGGGGGGNNNSGDDRNGVAGANGGGGGEGYGGGASTTGGYHGGGSGQGGVSSGGAGDSMHGGPGFSGLGGNGGQGTPSAITGTTRYYGAGGAGASWNTSTWPAMTPPWTPDSAGAGGRGGYKGGGDAGAPDSYDPVYDIWTYNGRNAQNGYFYGAGGGGAPGTITRSQPGNGFQGVVIIRYAGYTQLISGGVVTQAAGYTIHTFPNVGQTVFSTGSIGVPAMAMMPVSPDVEPVLQSLAPLPVPVIEPVASDLVVEPLHVNTVWETSMLHAGPHAAWQDPRTFCLSGWIFHTNVGIPPGIENIVARANDMNWADGFGVFYTRDGETGVLHAWANRWDGTGDGVLVQATAIPDLVWTNFVLQARPKQHGFDSEMEFWVNGVRKGGGTITGGIRYGTADNRFIFGNDLAAASPWKPFLGRLADFALFPRWMNQWEIADIFRSTPIVTNQKA